MRFGGVDCRAAVPFGKREDRGKSHSLFTDKGGGVGCREFASEGTNRRE